MAQKVTTVEDHRRALADEYGVYVALEPIDINGARAFNRGDPVPVSHVDRGVVDSSLVARRSTKAATAAVEPAS